MFAFQIMPPRRSDIRGNFFIPSKENVDGADPTPGVQTPI